MQLAHRPWQIIINNNDNNVNNERNIDNYRKNDNDNDNVNQ